MSSIVPALPSPTGPPPSERAASSTTVHMYSPTAQPNSSRNRSASSHEDHPGLARDRAGAEAAGRCDLRAKVERAEARDHLPGLGAEDRERGEARGDVDGVGWRGVVASEEQGSRRSQLTYPRVAFALGLAELAGDAVALELELAQVRDVGPGHGLAQRAPRRGTRPRRSSRRGPRTARRPPCALPSIGLRATAPASAAAGLRNARLTSGAPRRRGRRTAWSGRAPASSRPRRRSSPATPSRASGLGTQAIPITRSSTGEKRALVTWPAGAPPRVDDHRALGRHVPVGEREPDEAGRRLLLGVVLERPLADEVLPPCRA